MPFEVAVTTYDQLFVKFALAVFTAESFTLPLGDIPFDYTLQQYPLTTSEADYPIAVVESKGTKRTRDKDSGPLNIKKCRNVIIHVISLRDGVGRMEETIRGALEGLDVAILGNPRLAGVVSGQSCMECKSAGYFESNVSEIMRKLIGAGQDVSLCAASSPVEYCWLEGVN